MRISESSLGFEGYVDGEKVEWFLDGTYAGKGHVEICGEPHSLDLVVSNRPPHDDTPHLLAMAYGKKVHEILRADPSSEQLSLLDATSRDARNYYLRNSGKQST
jgi:hypothetical protein